MSNHAHTLASFAERLRPLMEQQRTIASDLRELMTEMRGEGLEGGVLKQWMAAMIDAEDGKEAKLQRLISRTQDAAIYGEVLGYKIDGFGETKRFVSQAAE